MFFLEKRDNIGLDIGHDSVKLAVVHRRKGIIRCLRKRLVITDRKSKDQMPTEQDLVTCITKLMAEAKKECQSVRRDVCASIYGGGSICHYLELPPLKSKELAVAVPSQAIKYIPFPMKDVTLSYVQVPPIAKGEHKSAVFFIAEQNQSVAFVKKLLKESDVGLVRIETPILAIPREFARDHKVPKERFIALVYSGFLFTYVILIRNRYPYYAREISIAGRDFTYAFQMGNQSSWQEAESYKMKYDVLMKEIPIEPFLTRWLDEVKKSLDFFQKQFGEQDLKVDKVVFSGGTAGFVNLDKRAADYLDLPVEIDRWESLKSDVLKEENSVIYNVAVGLALE